MKGLKFHTRMTRRLDEVNASMHPIIDELEPIDPILLLKVCVESGLDIVDYRLPTKVPGSQLA